MKLRTQLFLEIGWLFFFIALASYLAPAYLLHQELQKTEIEIRAAIKEEAKQQAAQVKSDLQHDLMVRRLSVDTVLYRLTEQPLLLDGFTAGADGQSRSTWEAAGELAVRTENIGFIQNSIDGEGGCTLIVRHEALRRAESEILQEGLAWVEVWDREDQKADQLKSQIFLGLEFPYLSYFSLEVPPVGTREKEKTDIKVPTFYLLMTPEALAANFQSYMDLWQKQTAYQPGMPSIPDLQKTRTYLQELLGALNSKDKIAAKEALDKMQTLHAAAAENPCYQLFFESFSGVKSVVLETDVLKELYFKPESRANVVSLLNRFLLLLAQGGVPFNPTDLSAPAGACHLFPEENAGTAILTKDLFFTQKLFDDQAHYAAYAKLGNSLPIAAKAALVVPPGMPEVFVVNTLKTEKNINGKTSTAYVTIGTELCSWVQTAAMLAQRMAFMADGTHVIIGYHADGTSIAPESLQQWPWSLMLQNPVGTVDYAGDEYLYYALPIADNSPIHLFIVQKTAEALALYNFIMQEFIAADRMIALERLIVFTLLFIIALFVLSRISKRISRPVVQLAAMTQEVAAGHYEQIVFPETPKASFEIQHLYHSFKEMVQGLQEREKMRAVLSKVVSAEIAQTILEKGIQLGGEERVVTVMFADIRGFTHMTSDMEPREVISMLNAFMTHMSSIIDKHAGVIDKYIGDEIMALFGAPVAHPDDALQAIKCAVAMIQELKSWNKERRSYGKKELNVGIGIHTGVMLTGNMGAENRLNYTVIGSNVNMGARLCASAQPMQILISAETLQASKAKEFFEIEGPHMVLYKGFAEALPTYAVVVPDIK